MCFILKYSTFTVLAVASVLKEQRLSNKREPLQIDGHTASEELEVDCLLFQWKHVWYFFLKFLTQQQEHKDASCARVSSQTHSVVGRRNSKECLDNVYLRLGKHLLTNTYRSLSNSSAICTNLVSFASFIHCSIISIVVACLDPNFYNPWLLFQPQIL